MTITEHLYLFAQGALGSCEELGLPGCDVANDNGVSGLQAIFNTIFIVTGVVSVIFIIIGGFRYTISGGNPQGTKQAWETILYAVIGLAVSLSALGIVTFVAGRV